MLNKKNIVLAATLIAMPIVGSASLKNNLSDWIYTSGSNKGEVINNNIKAVTKDGIDNDHGGQAFDSEAMYVTYEADTLYIAIVTGLEPGFTSGYFAGDILFNTNNYDSINDRGPDVDQRYDYAMTTYADDDDKTNLEGQIDGAEAGDLFDIGFNTSTWNKHNDHYNGHWKHGIWGGRDFKNAHPTIADKDKTDLDDKVNDLITKLEYTDISGQVGDIFNGNNHYMISASLNLSGKGVVGSAAEAIFTAFNSDKGLGIHWTPTCNNDYIHTTFNYDADNGTPDTPKVPEPASLALMGLGMFGLVGFRRKMKA